MCLFQCRVAEIQLLLLLADPFADILTDQPPCGRHVFNIGVCVCSQNTSNPIACVCVCACDSKPIKQPQHVTERGGGAMPPKVQPTTRPSLTPSRLPNQKQSAWTLPTIIQFN